MINSSSIIGREIKIFEEVTSTNDIAKSFAENNCLEGTVIVAKTQTKGRGRFGRNWFSPKGGIWCSVILYPNILSNEIHKIMFIAAVSVAKSVEDMYKVKCMIKWPNDLLILNKKFSGILTEAKSENEKVVYVILGIGINVNIIEFPKDLINATSLKLATSKEYKEEELLNALIFHLDKFYKIFKEGKFADILSIWHHYAMPFGKYVHVKNGTEEIYGISMGISDNGALIIRDDTGIIHEITSGEIINYER
jgi:BirA family biotin operon repressor/biotin-[acetyl-CoA-carboxylase] ligase